MPNQSRGQNHPTPKEKVDALMNKLETGIHDFMQSGKYQEYLRTMSKFHNYSFRNCVLIAMQKPDATYVAGYSAWKEKFDRQVGRGEKAIRILAPAPYEVSVEREKKDAHGRTVYGADGKPVTETVKEKRLSFRSASVFDVSQTDGKPLPQIAAELDGSVEDYELMLQAIRDTSDAPVTIEKFSGSAKGYYDRADHSIHIQEGMGEMQTVKTALHERAHSILHNDNAEGAAEKTRETKECEAESVAFVVCDHFGLDTGDYSFPYLASWSSGMDLPEIHASLETIQKTADDMISTIGARFLELKAERNAAQSDAAEDLTPAQQQKLERNLAENKAFTQQITDLFDGKLRTDEVLKVGTTPYSLRIVGAKAVPLIISQSTVRNSESSEKFVKHHTEGHDIPKETLIGIPDAVRNPVFVMKGNRAGSFVIISDVTDKADRNLLFALTLDVRGQKGTVNRIDSIYGKKNMLNYIQKAIAADTILAMNTKKADELSSYIGCQSPKSATILCFDNSITYTDENVKRGAEVFGTESERNAETQGVTGQGHKPAHSEAHPDRIGNTHYSEIADKTYIRVDPAKTDALIQELTRQKIPFAGKRDPVKGDIITISREYKPLAEKILAEGTLLKDDFGESRYARCSEAVVKALKKTDIPFQSRKQADGSCIIKFKSTDLEQIRQIVDAASAQRKKL
ncbi:MAG: hypothetical protein IKQ91_01720 [Oscillospiraceae bacterium]|nr:hypothetical protein [Oscillospiraceae bacterium]